MPVKLGVWLLKSGVLADLAIHLRLYRNQIPISSQRFDRRASGAIMAWVEVHRVAPALASWRTWRFIIYAEFKLRGALGRRHGTGFMWRGEQYRWGSSRCVALESPAITKTRSQTGTAAATRRALRRRCRRGAR